MPGDRDVLLGRGKAIYSQGNVWMRSLIAQSYAQFDEAKYGEKFQITARLVSSIKQKGGRFLKLRSDGWWFLADDKLAEDKVSRAFQTACLEMGSSAQARQASKTQGTSKKRRT